MKSISHVRQLIGNFISPNVASKIEESKSFDDVGISFGIDQSSLRHDYLGKYEQHLSKLGSDTCDIVILSNNNPIATGSAFAEFFSSSTVHLIWLGKSEIENNNRFNNLIIKSLSHTDDIHNYLAVLPNIKIIIDDGLNTKSSKLASFNDFFFHLKDGGVYVAEDLHASHIPERNDIHGDDVHRFITKLVSHKAFTKDQLLDASDTELALARSIRHLTSYGDIIFVTKCGRHAYKLADGAANAILNQRLGSSWGSIITTKPGGVFASKCTAVTNRPKLNGFFKKNVKYAALSARAYDQVICSPGQIVYREEFILPDTYRLAFRGNFNHRRLKEANKKFVSISDEMLHPTKYLDGEYFYLDREWSAYGHVPTEVISRLWAWDEAKRRYPQLKVLVSAPDTEDVLPPWEADLIKAYGIPAEDIVILTAPARVRKLVAATPMFEISDYIHPEIKAVWKRVRDGLIDPKYVSPERVFLSRKPGSLRDCRNSERLEQIFSKQGFTVIRPETLALGQQIALLCNAKVIAGYAGSALLNLVFADSSKSVIVIGTDSFMNANEYLITGMIGGSFTYFFCTAEIQQPKSGWSQRAYHSPFSFDFDQDGKLLSDTFETLKPQL